MDIISFCCVIEISVTAVNRLGRTNGVSIKVTLMKSCRVHCKQTKKKKKNRDIERETEKKFSNGNGPENAASIASLPI